MKINGKKNGNKIKPQVTAIIQARMMSKRLPGKAMLYLADKPILGHVIERAKKIDHVDTVVLATSGGKENEPLLRLADDMGIYTFIGSEDNVLERYYLAAEEFGGKYIVRITGDNPFTDVDYASMIVDIALESGFDLCALSNLPLGTAVEVIKREALKEAYKTSNKPYHFEHVTPMIKEHPELFSIERPPVNIKNKIDDLRLTIDTPEDYKVAQILADNLYKGEPFPLSDILDYIKDNPEIRKINSGVKQRLASHSS